MLGHLFQVVEILRDDGQGVIRLAESVFHALQLALHLGEGVKHFGVLNALLLVFVFGVEGFHNLTGTEGILALEKGPLPAVHDATPLALLLRVGHGYNGLRLWRRRSCRGGIAQCAGENGEHEEET